MNCLVKLFRFRCKYSDEEFSLWLLKYSIDKKLKWMDRLEELGINLCMHGLGIDMLSHVDGINAHIFTVINAAILIFGHVNYVRYIWSLLAGLTTFDFEGTLSG